VTSSVLRHQRSLNLESAALWEDYAAHRRRVTELILGHRTGRPSDGLVVLGAGNCNDLELEQLLDGFAAVHLVDIDAEALMGAAKRQRIPASACLGLHGDVDVTDPASAQIERLRQAARSGIGKAGGGGC